MKLGVTTCELIFLLVEGKPDPGEANSPLFKGSIFFRVDLILNFQYAMPNYSLLALFCYWHGFSPRQRILGPLTSQITPLGFQTIKKQTNKQSKHAHNYSSENKLKALIFGVMLNHM